MPENDGVPLSFPGRKTDTILSEFLQLEFSC